MKLEGCHWPTSSMGPKFDSKKDKRCDGQFKKFDKQLWCKDQGIFIVIIGDISAIYNDNELSETFI